MKRELLVVSDIAAAAAELFMGVKPRAIVLAGGQTPRSAYEGLAGIRYPWENVHVFFSDERCVSPNHPDSNYRMAYEALLRHIEAKVHRMPGETCDAAAYEDALRAYFRAGPPAFGLAFLGIGTDGHTASLFPNDPALKEDVRWVARVSRPDHQRLTLTLPVLSAAGTVIFLVSGREKRQALRQVLSNEDVPAAKVAAQRIVVIADTEAAT